ncbi:hypothetical protein [Candidatus Viridilinea mediisalina]|uniref:hypothetical protein n=1 Tax=Candidatus Viridilinea mediisalina TaxID=2024553 RepID=UPI000F5B6D9E|nr:hypothetical protein [Candidatus Viridilinea mediisalina]
MGTPISSAPPYGGPAYRARQAPAGEQQLVAHLGTTLGALFPHTFLVAYYVALKTNPLVVLTGLEGAGKAALASGFAAALVGSESGQFVTIGSDSWTRRGSQSHYYRDIHARFGASQFIETLHEAASPENTGKLYMILLKGLSVEELDLYANRLLQVGPDGERRLALPGRSADEQPILPPNCFITASLHLPQADQPLLQEVLRHTGQITFSPSLQAGTTLPSLPPPPVGLQRVMLAAVGHDVAAPRERLDAILGRRGRRDLGPSPEVARQLLATGVALRSELREHILAYVANSFDQEGRGLFVPTDPRRNAQIAFDAQVVQRLLWRNTTRRRSFQQRRTPLLVESV